MFGTPYYHATLKRHMLGFGSMFNNIVISREDENDVEERQFRVPIDNISKRKFHRVLTEKVAREGNTPEVQTYLPKLSFYIADINPVPEKNTVRNPICQENEDGSVTMIPVRTPYRITWELGIFTKKQEDGHKILEQILPYFRPYLNIRLRTTRNMQNTIREDVRLTLQDVSRDYDLESSLEDANLDVFIWTISFSSDMYMYGPPSTSGAGIIKTVNVDFIEGGTGKKMSRVTVAVDPEDAAFSSYGISQGCYIYQDDYELVTSASLGTTTGLLP